MLRTYSLGGEEVDSLDLKVLLITRGVNVASDDLYERFRLNRRISSCLDPTACDCVILPDGTIVHVANVGPGSPFELAAAENGNPCILFHGSKVTEVDLPPGTQFYQQTTSAGLPFKSMAVLQGLDVLSFQYLWPCDYARAGLACQYCHTGGLTQELARQDYPDPSFPTPLDVAEVMDYAVNVERFASHVQITGGSTMDPWEETRRIVRTLRAIHDVAGRENIAGEILVYTTPPPETEMIDAVFQAGADRVAYSLEVWDEALFERVCPGKARFAGRERYLRALEYVAGKYGPNRACSSFVVGIEPVESFLSGAEYLAGHGIVPIASVWMPYGRPVLGTTEAPGVEYYRRLRCGLAGIYSRHDCEPPGTLGFNVCLCRDTWNHRDALAGEDIQGTGRPLCRRNET